MSSCLTQTGGNRARRGFSLAEMLVVIAIISILMGLGIVAMNTLKTDANNAVTFTRIKTLYLALESFKTEFGFYPEPQKYPPIKPSSTQEEKELKYNHENNITMVSEEVQNGIITPDFREHFVVNQDLLDTKNRLIDPFGAPFKYIYTDKYENKDFYPNDADDEDIYTVEFADRVQVLNEDGDPEEINPDMIHPVIFIYSLGPDGKEDANKKVTDDTFSVWPLEPPQKAKKFDKDEPLDINDGALPFGPNNDNIYYNLKGD
ncbi:MAG: prepilin-type N-terminal cleavage/methylation domain-containing protein [Planctomycetes bacterium]|nr:prepilin-type N-terminal cleavage/methylation domain-containing protein [Planctomycetota bacterium]